MWIGVPVIARSSGENLAWKLNTSQPSHSIAKESYNSQNSQTEMQFEMRCEYNRQSYDMQRDESVAKMLYNSQRNQTGAKKSYNSQRYETRAKQS
jgi:hypothetical protein